MRLTKPWSVTTLAVVGLFALAGCGGDNASEANPSFEAVEESSSPMSADPQPETEAPETEAATEGFGTEESDTSGDDSLLATCQDYAAFDRGFVADVENIMTLAADPEASEEEMAAAHGQMEDFRSEFEGIIAEAENQEFIDNAEKTLESLKIFEQMTEPGASMSEKDALSSDPAMQEGVAAEEQLVQLCNTELGF